MCNVKETAKPADLFTAQEEVITGEKVVLEIISWHILTASGCCLIDSEDNAGKKSYSLKTQLTTGSCLPSEK